MARRWVMELALVISVAAAGESEASAPSIRYSGTVVDIDVADGRLVLDEVGPSCEGGSRIIRGRIALTPETEYTVVLGALPAGGYPVTGPVTRRRTG